MAAPDGRSRAVARWLETGAPTEDGEGVEVKVSGALGALDIPLGPGVGSELLWRGDSQAFAVTTSDGGAGGTFRTLAVGRFRHDRVEIFDVSPMIRRAFGHPVRCGWPEDPNVAAIGWSDTGGLIVAAEIRAHSNCDSFGAFRAYEVDLARRRIVGQWNQIEAKRRFGPLLGQELRGSPDECVRTPRACWVATNHPDGR